MQTNSIFNKIFSSGPTKNDFLSSIVVFLVALPLCMGIALASGVPPALGIITGIIGGIVVGLIAGSPLQVSGPAAGLTVMVWEIVNQFGLTGMSIVVALAGLFQFTAGIARLGQWFRAVSPALIKGMLAGIGVLIFASQFHVMLDQKAKGSGILNLVTIPAALKEVFTFNNAGYLQALTLGAVVIGTIILWDRFAKGALKILPGALMGILGATFLSVFFLNETIRVELPQNLFSHLNQDFYSAAIGAFSMDLVGVALALALVASAESLLCASAVDQMHSGVRTKYDKELAAQGVGNFICGLLGALPMTGVIVRSSANVQAGAKTKWSTIFHGALLLTFVAAAPHILRLIPTAALAAILVFTGIKLVNVKDLMKLWREERPEAMVYLATLFTIVATDLLTGVVVGFAVLILKTLFSRSKLHIDIEENKLQLHTEIHLSGAATFLQLPKLAKTIEQYPLEQPLKINVDKLDYIDLACRNLIESRQALASKVERPKPVPSREPNSLNL